MNSDRACPPRRAALTEAPRMRRLLQWGSEAIAQDVRNAWQLVRHDLLLWVAVAAGLALAERVSQSVSGDPRVALALAAGAVLATTVLMALRFATADGRWEQTRPTSRALRRIPLLVANLLAAVTLSAAGGVIFGAAILLLRGWAAVAPLIAAAGGTLVYLSLLCRFCFVPFLALLEDEPLGSARTRTGLGLVRVTWPLLESGRRTEGLRLRLSPYVALTALGPSAIEITVGKPPLLAAVLWHLLTITAQAAIFTHYARTRDR